MVIKNIDGFIDRTIVALVPSQAWQQSLQQFVKFLIIGVANTTIDFGIYYYLTRHIVFFDVATPKKYLANVISFLVATTFSFFANRNWTFKREDRASLGEAARFYSTTVSGLGLNELLLFILIRSFHVYDLIAKVFATFVTIFWNFLFKKFFVFTPPKTGAQPNNT